MTVGEPLGPTVVEILHFNEEGFPGSAGTSKGFGVGVNAADQVSQALGGGGGVLNPFVSVGFVLYPSTPIMNLLDSVSRK